MKKLKANSFNNFIEWISISYSRFEDKLSKLREHKLFVSGAWIAVVLGIFVTFLFLNIFTPLLADDFSYIFICGSDRVLVSSLGDVVQSQINHYFSWGGRSVAHSIAQILLMLPPMVADILNTLAHLTYVFLVYLLIKGKNKGGLVLFILVNIATWFIQPIPADTTLWLVGSSNYLWCSLFIMSFILPFRLYEGKAMKGICKFIFPVFLFLWGIIAGWTNENTAGAMLLIVILFMVYFRSNKWKMPVWAITGLVGGVIGYAIMILAPGNAGRAGDAGFLSLYINFYRILMHTLTLFNDYGFLLGIYVATLILFFRFTHNGEKAKNMKISFIFILGFLSGIYAMVFSPSFPPRAWFGVLTFFMIGLGILFHNLNYEQKFIRQIKYSILVLGIVANLFGGYYALKDTHVYYVECMQREKEIEIAKAEGKSVCIFEMYVPRTKFGNKEKDAHKSLIGIYYGIAVEFE